MSDSDVKAAVQKHSAEHLRLLVLRMLDQAGMESNERVLRSAAEEFGHRPSADAFRVVLGWLEEVGLVSCRQVEGVFVCRLTQRGLDAAIGSARIPGLARAVVGTAPEP